MKEEIPLAPISGWEIAPISAHGALMLRLSYLTHATQQPDEAQQTPQLVMTQEQAQALIEALKRALERLESGPPEGAGLPRH